MALPAWIESATWIMSCALGGDQVPVDLVSEERIDMERSRGGLTTKIDLLANDLDLPVDFLVTG